jgi:antagonist of KipI
VLNTLPGGQAEWFAGSLFASRASEGPVFTVSPASNRMGVRLRGTAVKVSGREMVSEPVCPGTVQVTNDGQCILLGVDGQTIGGYPKIAQVIQADLDRLGQLRPGGTVCFRWVSLHGARRRARQRRQILHRWLSRLRFSNPLLTDPGIPGKQV